MSLKVKKIIYWEMVNASNKKESGKGLGLARVYAALRVTGTILTKDGLRTVDAIILPMVADIRFNYDWDVGPNDVELIKETTVVRLPRNGVSKLQTPANLPVQFTKGNTLVKVDWKYGDSRIDAAEHGNNNQYVAATVHFRWTSSLLAGSVQLPKNLKIETWFANVYGALGDIEVSTGGHGIIKTSVSLHIDIKGNNPASFTVQPKKKHQDIGAKHAFNNPTEKIEPLAAIILRGPLDYIKNMIKKYKKSPDFLRELLQEESKKNSPRKKVLTAISAALGK